MRARHFFPMPQAEGLPASAALAASRLGSPSKGTTPERAPDPEWDALPFKLVAVDDLRQAFALAQGVGIEDLRLGPVLQAFAAHGNPPENLSPAMLDDGVALRRPL